jgi:membrane protease YdiL (CAAX protease family)
MDQIFSQIILFTLSAGLVWLLTKYLKCKPSNPGIVNPRNSSLKALFAVACSLIALVLFEYFRRTPHAGLLAPGAMSEPIGYLMPSLISFVIFLLPAGIAANQSNEPLRSFGISRTNLWQSALIGSAFVILMFYMQNIDPFETIREFEQQQGIRLIYFAFIGFEEEILFRGYLQTRLIAWLGKWQGWGLASIIMALGHFPFCTSNNAYIH